MREVQKKEAGMKQVTRTCALPRCLQTTTRRANERKGLGTVRY